MSAGLIFLDIHLMYQNLRQATPHHAFRRLGAIATTPCGSGPGGGELDPVVPTDQGPGSSSLKTTDGDWPELPAAAPATRLGHQPKATSWTVDVLDAAQTESFEHRMP